MKKLPKGWKKVIKDVQSIDEKGNKIVVKDVSVTISEEGEEWLSIDDFTKAIKKQYGKLI